MTTQIGSSPGLSRRLAWNPETATVPRVGPGISHRHFRHFIYLMGARSVDPTVSHRLELVLRYARRRPIHTNATIPRATAETRAVTQPFDAQLW